MSTYAVGDVQGCRAELEELLSAISFSADTDRIWFVGDLVNRGPDSLGVLRLVRDLGDSAVVVLGNHDLHLLARRFASHSQRSRDAFDEIVAAPDCDELLDWLRARPLLHHEGEYVLVHAGLAPEWTVREAVALAREAEDALHGSRIGETLRHYHESAPRPWSAVAHTSARVAGMLHFLTRVRMLHTDGRPGGYAGPPQDAPVQSATQSQLCEWFRFPGRRSADATIVFGHWAALGFHREPGIIALDSGCVWGHELTALRLEDGQITQVRAQ